MERSGARDKDTYLSKPWRKLMPSVAEILETGQKCKTCLMVSTEQIGSPKGQQLRMILRNEFKKNMGETDPEKVKVLKGNNDPRLKQRMDVVKTHALSDLKQREHGQDHQ